MREEYQIIEIDKSRLDNKMRISRDAGCRLVQIHAVSLTGITELTYSVATPDNRLTNYRVVLKDGEEIDSITDIFPAAVLYENEIKELFGVNINCIAIDYNRRFYDIAVEDPMKKEAEE